MEDSAKNEPCIKSIAGEVSNQCRQVAASPDTPVSAICESIQKRLDLIKNRDKVMEQISCPANSTPKSPGNP